MDKIKNKEILLADVYRYFLKKWPTSFRRFFRPINEEQLLRLKYWPHTIMAATEVIILHNVSRMLERRDYVVFAPEEDELDDIQVLFHISA